MNLRHVPEALRPPQETPDPDDDPTREWRERKRFCEKGRVKRGDTQLPAGENRGQFVRRNHFELGISAVARPLVRAPPSKMRHVPEAGALHVLISDFDHQLGPQRLPRQVLALAPAALAARHAMPGFTVAVTRAPPIASRGDWPARPRGRAPGIPPAPRRFSAVKLAHTPTCCNAPESSKSPSNSEPTAVRSPFLYHRNPATTQSQSRSCLTLSITRLFGS